MKRIKEKVKSPGYFFDKRNSSPLFHAHSQRQKLRKAMKRIPRIKFPQRHPKSSGNSRQVNEMSLNDDVNKNDDLVRKFFSRAPSMSAGGKASDQPKRTPVSQEEIDSIMLGGCI